MSSPQQPKRRQFFKIASAGTVATASGALPMMLLPEAALAAEVLGADALKTLTKMARDIFPHDRFEDTLYTNAVRGSGEQAQADAKLKKLLWLVETASQFATRDDFADQLQVLTYADVC